MTHGVQNDLENIGQGHSAQNSSESSPRCTHILKMKVLGQLGPDLSRGEGWSTHVGREMTLKNRSRSFSSELIRELPKMHSYSEYEGSRTIRARLIAQRRMVNTSQAGNELEKIGQGKSAQYSSGSFPRCNHILNTRTLCPRRRCVPAYAVSIGTLMPPQS